MTFVSFKNEEPPTKKQQIGHFQQEHPPKRTKGGYAQAEMNVCWNTIFRVYTKSRFND